jgi:acetyl esterase/lipase
MPAALHESVVYKRVGGAALRLHITRPAVQPAGPAARPAVLFFHGGAWRTGTPNKLMPFAALVADHGLIGMSVEYRLLKDGDGAIPKASIADARSAVRWVKAHAARLGCDATRIAAAGSSAGGYLAMATCLPLPPQAEDDALDDALDDRSDGAGAGADARPAALDDEARPAALVLISAPLDFDHYPSPVPLAARRLYAPLHLLASGLVPALPPTLLLYGTADKTVPASQARRFADKAAALGLDQVVLRLFEGGDHHFAHAPQGDFPAVGRAMLDFFRSQGWPAP